MSEATINEKRQCLNVSSAGVPPDLPASPAVAVGPFVFVGSTGATDWNTGLDPEARPDEGFPLHGSNPIKLESRHIYKKLRACLEAGGSSLEQTVQVNQWFPCYYGDVIRDPETRNAGDLFFEDWRAIAEPYRRVRNEFILKERPASVAIPVDRLLCADEHVEVEIVGLTERSGIQKRAYEHEAHVPTGGYSMGIEAGPWLFTAGFIATDFSTGVHPNARIPDFIWYGNRIANEVDETLRELKLAVEAGNARWEDTVKAVVYVTPFAMRNLPAIEEVWKRYWPEDPPARSIVPVSGIGVRTLNIEINLIVARPQLGGEREAIHADKALPPLGHAPQAVKSGPLLFLSTQLGRSRTGALSNAIRNNQAFPFLRRSIKDQIRAIQENVQTICEAAGSSINQTVKANLFFSDFHDLAPALPVWAEAFDEGYPASGFFEGPFVQEVPECTVTADLTIAC